jgi:subtilisin family serine protease
VSGKINTEGDSLLGADIARGKFNLDGSGVKIGIISTSFDAQGKLFNDVENGELPGTAIKILKDLPPLSLTANDEGRALAQIIHDVAPGTELVFHTAANDSGITDEQSYSKAVQSLADDGVDIIVDDAILPTAIFADGEAAQSAKIAVDNGIVFISAAGNNGKTSYQSEYRSDGTTFQFAGKTFEAFDFDSSSNIDFFQDITATKDGTVFLPLLTWSDPNNKVSSDLEMFLLSSDKLPSSETRNILAISDFPSTTALDDPLRELAYPTMKDQKLYLVIGRELNGTKPPDFLKWISAANGLDRTTKYQYINSNDLETGSSTIYGPANLEETIAVGATDVKQDFTSGLATVRSYSSQGGAPILFDEEGNSLCHPDLREKPDLIAPDGVSTSVEGFKTFNGTSAAAPHIAGIVALMEQAAGGSDVFTPKQIKEILQSSSIPLSSTPNVFGGFFGLPQADLAVANILEYQELGVVQGNY